ncbi:hypothetical protein ARALYDRAFT_890953 [Arabidopsis lyrata subsp. lyrata]|uniref:Uncharacterized protein n=1 Tax=Arabidopsis lyrata subsp. lyrata TaxID=81972 RepID=D7KJ94_ARALL|nr:hypothetical protein ARALYDRAFT_890953 [Arabidopsis lyrata subsp. lyrata]
MEAARMGFGAKTLPHPLATASSKTSGDVESSRPLPHVAPNLWGDLILSVRPPITRNLTHQRQIESIIKTKVRNMLMSSHDTDEENMSHPLAYLSW